MTSRRDLLKFIGSAAVTGAVLGTPRLTRAAQTAKPMNDSPNAPKGGDPTASGHRPPPSQRKFTSPAVEAEIHRVKADITDPKLARLFENCYPNTLDTTVEIGTLGGKADTFVITGDIDAMWLRDSSAQVNPYLPLAKRDAKLRRLFHGLINRQARCIHIDAYANAFMPDPHARPLTWARHDDTDMKPGVGERKWEIDSLCYPVRLAYGYWKATGDTTPFDADWRAAMHTLLDTFRTQQRLHDRSPYHFQRSSPNPTDTQFLSGYGNPTRPNGMIHSMFRPSDDACVYPLFVPANLFAASILDKLAEMSQAIHHDGAFADDCRQLAHEVRQAVHKHARLRDEHGREYWAYEIDGYGNTLFMDDANAPGLSSLAYLGACKLDDPLYQASRSRAWSEANPYFFKGSAAEGIGGPHEGLRMIWPMSIMMRALTSTNAQEIGQCLTWLKSTDAGTGFMHEAFDQDNPAKFTRSWFAWANTLFGELILRVHAEHPALLRS
ncbi:glycoside hydrolase family 125 protein [Oleiagrimonas sp. C23AA]|uniref:glycoside hydrolase family 125 protein n=1 Tax=Oleiagrimonas sp. C23AA TaxID=2719047 RepID=UPI00142453D1|nr:glycoside hydrolase family 125 protein [Oleiagrimonas sp. C23AA]NII10772.1 glycoside hydrolase family 125 protein [Oleiagrimonas sp. C23AA]